MSSYLCYPFGSPEMQNIELSAMRWARYIPTDTTSIRDFHLREGSFSFLFFFHSQRLLLFFFHQSVLQRPNRKMEGANGHRRWRSSTSRTWEDWAALKRIEKTREETPGITLICITTHSTSFSVSPSRKFSSRGWSCFCREVHLF